MSVFRAGELHMFQQALVQRVLDKDNPGYDIDLDNRAWDMNEEVGTCGICGVRFTRGDGYGCRRCMSDSDD